MAAPKTVNDPTTKDVITLSPRQQHQWRSIFGQALQEGWDNSGNMDDVQTLRRVEGHAREVATQSVLGLR